MAAINTGKVTDYRNLRFKSIDELLAEVDRIVAAEAKGTLRRTGNWTTGQILSHLATWINFGYDGFPAKANPPWPVKMFLRWRIDSYIRNGMPRGVKIPGILGGTLAIEPTTTEEGARQLRAALMRLKNGESAKFHSPAFGPVTEERRIEMQFRHAECHLGYLHP